MRTMRFNLVQKLLLLIISFALFTMCSFSVVLYSVIKSKVTESAGIELVGCAEITKKLVDVKAIANVLKGDQQAIETIRPSIEYIVDSKPIFKDAFLVDATGKVLIADKRLLTEGVKEGDMIPFDITEVAKSAEHHKTYTDSYIWHDVERFAGFAAIEQDGKLLGYMVIEFDQSIIQERTIDSVVPALQIVWIFPLLATVVSYIVIKRGIRPLLVMSSEVEKVAAGDLSFDTTIFHSKDEIETLSISFHKMVKGLSEIIGEVNQTGLGLASSSSALFESSKKTSQINQQIAKEIQLLVQDSEDQLFQTKESAAAMDEISSQVTQIAKNSDVMKRSTSSTASAIQELASSVEQISKGSHHASNLAQEVQKDATIGHQQVDLSKAEMLAIAQIIDEAADVMKHLGDSSKEIGKIVEVIDGIAEQTNLLALNAAIEAARAGEHGKGFSVVADEVKNLAERSANATKEIADLIKGIQEETQQAVRAIDIGNEKVNEGNRLAESASASIEKMVQGIAQISKELHEIRATTSMQAEKSTLIVKDITILEEQVNQVAKATQEQTIGVNEITQSIGKIAKITQHATEQLHEISLSSKAGSDAIESITADAPEQLDHLAHQLTDSVRKFKLNNSQDV